MIFYPAAKDFKFSCEEEDEPDESGSRFNLENPPLRDEEDHPTAEVMIRFWHGGYFPVACGDHWTGGDLAVQNDEDVLLVEMEEDQPRDVLP
ncbi:hypothetical protein Dimus_037055 [Dionaea muscipula]